MLMIALKVVGFLVVQIDCIDLCLALIHFIHHFCFAFFKLHYVVSNIKSGTNTLVLDAD